MKYNFDKIINRRGTNSYKWDVAENELPMWVADMDFETAPEIMMAVNERAKRGAFGYNTISDDWYDAYVSWWDRRHNWLIDREWLIFSTGVIPSLSSVVRKLTTMAEKVVVMTPVYNIFFNSIINNGRRILEAPLKYNSQSCEYDVDFEDLEEKLSDPLTTMLILCNPHNPVGKIWNRDTLMTIGEMCKKHHVIVISDEIHCDITKPGTEYIPFASVSDVCRENSVTLIAPTKAFNIAGLQTSAVVVPNEGLRNRVNRALNTDEVAEPNTFAIQAAVAAFNSGEEWLNQLREYIWSNIELVKSYVFNEIPEIKVIDSNATYLLWLDCSSITDDSERLAEEIRRKTGLYLSAGEHYSGNGNLFLRMNVACPRSMVEDGLNRLKCAIKNV